LLTFLRSGAMSSGGGWDGAALREHLRLERQRQHVLAGRTPPFDRYRGALVSGGAVGHRPILRDHGRDGFILGKTVGDLDPALEPFLHLALDMPCNAVICHADVLPWGA
jgi:hypothetical protein